MAGIFPTLSFGEVAMAPVGRGITRATRVIQFENDGEQRWQVAPALVYFDVQFRRMKIVDVDALETFFYTQKGSFDSTWTFPFLGTSYTNMCFDSDEFNPSESGTNRWSVNFRIRQTKKSIPIPSVLAVFPQINGGIRTQHPFTRSVQFRTSRNDMESGLRYAYFHRDFPMLSWTHNYPVITWTEGGTILDFFCAMGGRYRTFQYTDAETGEVLNHCRFGSDEITMSYVSPNVVSISNLQIVQFFG